MISVMTDADFLILKEMIKVNIIIGIPLLLVMIVVKFLLKELNGFFINLFSSVQYDFYSNMGYCDFFDAFSESYPAREDMELNRIYFRGGDFFEDVVIVRNSIYQFWPVFGLIDYEEREGGLVLKLRVSSPWRFVAFSTVLGSFIVAYMVYRFWGDIFSSQFFGIMFLVVILGALVQLFLFIFISYSLRKELLKTLGRLASGEVMAPQAGASATVAAR